jgi:twitching motility two-component system response regulator PilG
MRGIIACFSDSPGVRKLQPAVLDNYYENSLQEREAGMDAISKNQTGFTVLMVDDSKSIRHSTQILLSESGFSVSCAEDGFEALCKLATVKPDIILMDIMMPRLDGFHTCALIRQHSQFKKIPLILMSASDSPVDQVKAELVGAQRYIIKPFARNDLLQALRDLLPRSGQA